MEQSKLETSELHSEMKQQKNISGELTDHIRGTDSNPWKYKFKHKFLPPPHTPPYLQMDIAVFEFGLSNQRSFHRSKLRAFGDTPFGEHTSQKPVYIEHQGEAGSCLSQHGPVWDWMQRSMFRTHRGMRVITLFTPCNTERTQLSGGHSCTSSEETALSL